MMAVFPPVLATVPRRGYRFLVPVAEHHEAVSDPAEPVSLAVPPPQATPEAPSTPRVASLRTALPLPEAERRLLTVLCCDLMDSTALAGHLDLEDFQRGGARLPPDLCRGGCPV
jgi:hypothetical protein